MTERSVGGASKSESLLLMSASTSIERWDEDYFSLFMKSPKRCNNIEDIELSGKPNAQEEPDRYPSDGNVEPDRVGPASDSAVGIKAA